MIWKSKIKLNTEHKRRTGFELNRKTDGSWARSQNYICESGLCVIDDRYPLKKFTVHSSVFVCVLARWTVDQTASIRNCLCLKWAVRFFAVHLNLFGPAIQFDLFRVCVFVCVLTSCSSQSVFLRCCCWFFTNKNQNRVTVANFNMLYFRSIKLSNSLVAIQYNWNILTRRFND